MDYYDIVVHVDNSKACRARLATAVSLARRFDARLHGCCIVPPVNIAMYGEGAIAADMIQAEFQKEEERLGEAEATFRKAVADTDLEFQCTVAKGQPDQVLIPAARNADLCVVGQPDESDPLCTSAGVAPAVAFGAGSAVLVHPCVGEFPDVGQRLLIAWDGSREAQRAVSEALPLLRRASHVEVVSVITGSSLGEDPEQPAKTTCERLARRGITAHAHYVAAPDEAAGDTLLARCDQAQIDSLVLGAYGHSRLREFLLGGVTRTILKEHRMPVLLAH
jgi:nucleotide-binding universal stress UspA family protein